MTLFIIIVVLAYLVALYDGATRLCKFLQEVDEDAQTIIKNRRK